MAARKASALACATALLVLAISAPAAFGGGFAYWGAGTTGSSTIRSAPLDGSGGATSLFAHESTVGGIAIDPAAGMAYWSNATSREIRTGNLDGTGSASSMFGAELGPEGVAIDPAAGKIYWAVSHFTPGAGAIRVGNLDGSGSPEDLYTGQSYPEGLAIDPAAGMLYWANSLTSEIRAGTLDGSGWTTLFSGEPEARAVAVDHVAGKIYWTTRRNTIRVGNLDGSGTAEDLYADAGNAFGLAIDPVAGKIYWVAGGGIREGNLDGSGVVSTLVSGEPGPMLAMALLSSPLGTAPPVVSGAGEIGNELSCDRGGWAADLPAALLYREPRTFAYQWERDGADLDGATAPTLRPAVGGRYRCRVSASNQAGPTSQTSAPVAIPAPPGESTAPSTTAPSRFGQAPPTTPAPKVTIVHSPNRRHAPNPRGGPRWSFRFADRVPGVTFRCRIDGRRFKPCASPTSYRNLSRGRHVFRVKSVDAAGDWSPVRTVRFIVGKRRG